MKKSLLFGILGLAAGVASSYGQGFISLDNYAAYSGGYAGGIGNILYGAGAGGPLGTGITGGYTVGIYFAAGNVTGSSDATSGSGIPLGLALGSGTGSTTAFNGSAPGLFVASGYFQASPLSTDQTVTLEVVAYNGANYASSSFRGHSASFTFITATGTEFPGSVGNTFGTFSVVSVPEPTTLALAGLGGLSLLMLRRKQS